MEINTKMMGIGLICLAIILGTILIVVKIDFDRQGVFLCEAVQENPDLEMKDCPAHQSNAPWLIILAFGVVFLMLAGGFYLFFSTKVITPPTKKEPVDLSQLNEEEKTVYQYIVDKGGSAYQSDLIKATEMSKVKMTRLLDSLEHDSKLIERKRRGMTNIVVLKE